MLIGAGYTLGYYLYNLFLRRRREPGTYYKTPGCRYAVRVRPHGFAKPSQILKAIARARIPMGQSSTTKRLRKRENRLRQRDPVYRKKAREAAIAWESKSVAEKAFIWGIAAIAGGAR